MTIQWSENCRRIRAVTHGFFPLALSTDSWRVLRRQRVGRVDLLLEAFKITIEYDGDQHGTYRTQWNIDLDRDDAFADLGYLTIRVTSRRMQRPRDVVRRVFLELVQRGYAGPPPHFSAEWSALFEVRRIR